MLSVEKAVTAVKAGCKKLTIPQNGVTFVCECKGDKALFTPSFPKGAPQIDEATFKSNYYGKQFVATKAVSEKSSS